MDPQAALVLVAITLGAVAMPGVARRLSVPVAVAEIVYGLAIGASGLALAGHQGAPFIEFLGDVGFAFFMFIAGLELDFAEAGRKGPGPPLMGVVLAAGSLMLAIVLALSQGWGLWMGLAIGATSVPLLLAVVREMELSGTKLGGQMVVFAALGETLTILLLSIIDVQHHAEGVADLFFGMVRLLTLAMAVLVAGTLFRALLWWYPRPFARLVAFDDPSEIGVRVGFGILFGFVGLSVLSPVRCSPSSSATRVRWSTSSRRWPTASSCRCSSSRSACGWK
jgi:Kef-type K+ transport system membrane component KefB